MTVFYFLTDICIERINYKDNLAIIDPYNNGKFLQGVPQIEVHRASIENEVGWPAFAAEKGRS